jgi:hypothetical protein
MVMSLISMMALSFDMGLLHTAKQEAQNAADAAALAGASAFMIPSPGDSAEAAAEAIAYATANPIRNVNVLASEVNVQVYVPTRRVHVFIRRAAMQLWFARLFGIATVPIAASAMAHASPANIVDCVVPLALPDWWDDPDDDDGAGGGIPGNRIPDGNETWDWGDDPGTERYERFNFDATITETGLGSMWRNNYAPLADRDQGRLMVIKQQSSGSHQGNPINLNPGWYYPLDFDFSGYGPNGWFGAMVAAAQGNCLYAPTAVGDSLEVDTQNGKGAGPTAKAFRDIVNLDPNAYWDPVTKQVLSPTYAPNESPRILKILMFDPGQIGNIQGKSTIVPNNMALYFVEAAPQGNNIDVQGRFLRYAQGFSSGGGPIGSLTLRLQLIQ